MNWLIVTDLDGTLLDDRYPNRKAGAAIDAVSAAHPDARVALASSKTPAEMIELAEHCGSDPILIFENGTGMLWREHVLCRPGSEKTGNWELERFGKPYGEILSALAALRMKAGYTFRGFSDMTPCEVASRTGLSLSAAEKARMRVGTEPIVWEGDAEAFAEFIASLAELDLKVVSGGRFHHVGSHLNKGQALGKLWRLLRFQFGIHARTIACGDAPNDLDMLERADHAIVFPSSDGEYLRVDNPSTAHAASSGPGAWLNAVSELLDHHQAA